jgi:allophanate hydrolase
MLTGPAGSDARLAEIAARCDQADVDLLVVGAHLSGQPLNHELLAAGGTLLGPAATAPAYRLYALDTQPPKPGLVRVGPPAAADAGASAAEQAGASTSAQADASAAERAGASTSVQAGASAAEQAGASIAGEVWRLPAAGFARFMTGLAAPMAIGRVYLDDGRDVLGFLCEQAAVQGAADITPFGGWRAWIGRR